MVQTVQRTVVVDRFVAADREFNTINEAENYLKGLEHFNEFMNGRFIDHLPKGIPLDTVGTWLIRDEGPIDFGAWGSPKNLACLHGSLINAIKYACTEVKGFWGYGPGYIEVLNVVEV